MEDSDIILDNKVLFYSTFLKLSQDTEPLIDEDCVGMLRDRSFSKFVIENEEPEIAVKILSTVFKHSIIKPQRLLFDHEDYYIASDLLTNTYYICYRDLMMIDIDRYKRTDSDTLEEIKMKLGKHPELYFRIFSSRGGYHVFVLNKSMDYKADSSIRLMHELGCDFYYIVYSFLRGWSVRLNKKEGEEKTDDLYQWVGDVVRGVFFSCDIGNVEDVQQDEIIESKDISAILPDDRLEELVCLHIRLVDVFKSTYKCSMPAP